MKRILQKLFLGPKHVDLEDLRAALDEVEKDRRKNRREIRRWERKRKQTIEKMKKQRAAGNSMEVDYLWDEFKEHRRLGNDLKREGRIYNAEGIALRRTVKSLERMERRKDHSSARALLERIRTSGLAEKIALERESQSEYLEELNVILDEFDEVTEEERADPEKALFLAELDTIRLVEEAGDSESAAEKEEELLERFGEESEGEAV